MIYPWYGFSKDIMSEKELNHVKALYAGEVTMVDRWLGRLFETIELTGLKENTLVMLMSDHGHYFGDHGSTPKPSRAGAAGWCSRWMSFRRFASWLG